MELMPSEACEAGNPWQGIIIHRLSPRIIYNTYYYLFSVLYTCIISPATPLAGGPVLCIIRRILYYTRRALLFCLVAAMAARGGRDGEL